MSGVTFTAVLITTTFILILALQPSSAKWEFELLLHSYKNPTNTAFFNKEDVHCCDINVLKPCSDDPCDNVFNVTLSPITCQPKQGRINQQPCSYGSYQSSIFMNADAITFNTSSVGTGFTNPLKFSGKTWPPKDYVMLMIYIEDYDSSLVNDFVDLLILPLLVSPKLNFSPLQHYTGFYNYSFIAFSYRMKCAENYFGPTCDNPVPRNSANINISTVLNTYKTSKISPIPTSCIEVYSNLTIGDELCSSYPAHSSLPEASRMTLFVYIGLGTVIFILLILLLASCITIVQLYKKNRRKTTLRRPHTPKTLSVSVHSSIQLQKCPAYDEDNDSFSEEMDNDMEPLYNRLQSI